MPARLAINLRGVDPKRVSTRDLHYHACRWIDVTDEQHRSGTQPFSITPLIVSDETRSHFEIRLLDDRLIDRVIIGVTRDAGQTINLGRQHVRVDRRAPVSVVEVVDWIELIDCPSGPAKAWGLDVLSPLLFRRGNRSVPLPTPNSCIESVARRWRAFAPFSPLGTSWIDGPRPMPAHADLWITEMQGSTATIEVKRRCWIGWTGSLEFEVDRSGTKDSKRTTHALMSLARYAGVGSMTTFGLGVVEAHPLY